MVETPRDLNGTDAWAYREKGNLSLADTPWGVHFGKGGAMGILVEPWVLDLTTGWL